MNNIISKKYREGLRWAIIIINLFLDSWFGFFEPGTGYYDENGSLEILYIFIRSLLVVFVSFLATAVIIKAKFKALAISIIFSFLFGVMLLWAGLVTNSMSEYSGMDGVVYGCTTFFIGFTFAMLLCSSVNIIQRKLQKS